MGREEHAGRLVHTGGSRARKTKSTPSSTNSASNTPTAGTIEAPAKAGSIAMNEVCRVKGRAGVGLLTALARASTSATGCRDLREDVDSGRWIEARCQDARKGYADHRGMPCTCTPATPTIRTENGAEVPFPRHHAGSAWDALRDEAAHGGTAGRALRRFQHRAHAARHQERQGQREARRLPARGTRLRGQMAGGVGIRGCDAFPVPETSKDRTPGGASEGRAFDNNVGWRIDYQFATPELAETARGFVIDKAPTYDLRWSDHAPLSITYDV